MKLKTWLRKQKTKECKTLFGKIVQMIVFHNLSRIGFFALLLLGGGGLTNIPAIENIGWVVMLIGAAGLAIHVLIAIAYAWIINPIRSLKERKKERKI